MNKLRISALILALVMIVSCFAACGGNNNAAETTATTAGTTAATTASASDTSATSAATEASTTEATTTEATTEAKLDLGGYEYILANANHIYVESPATQLETDQMDIIADLESEYNFTFNYISVSDDTLMASFIAGESVADTIETRQQFWAPLGINGWLRPLETAEVAAAGLNINDETQVDYFFTHMTELQDHVWGVSFSGKYFTADFGHGIAFNKRLLEAAGYKTADLYQTVRDGNWNWDKFIEIARAISTDSDGDGKMDVWGYATMANEYQELLSNGVPFVYYDDATGKWTAGASNPNMIKAADWYMGWMNDDDVDLGYLGDSISNGDRRTMFCNGEIGLICLWGGNFGSDPSDINNSAIDDFGFIPFPKGPDATNYPHYIPDLYSLIIPMSNHNWEKTCAVLGLLGDTFNNADDSRELVREYMRDDESVEMIYDYMLPYAQVQTARYSPEIRAVTKSFVDYFTDANNTAAGVCEQFTTELQAAINNLFNQQ